MKPINSPDNFSHSRMIQKQEIFAVIFLGRTPGPSFGHIDMWTTLLDQPEINQKRVAYSLIDICKIVRIFAFNAK